MTFAEASSNSGGLVLAIFLNSYSARAEGAALADFAAAEPCTKVILRRSAAVTSRVTSWFRWRKPSKGRCAQFRCDGAPFAVNAVALANVVARFAARVMAQGR